MNKGRLVVITLEILAFGAWVGAAASGPYWWLLVIAGGWLLNCLISVVLLLLEIADLERKQRWLKDGFTHG